MRYLIVVMLLGGWMLFSHIGRAQGFKEPFRFPDESSLTGGLGFTWIDGQPHTTLTLAPDIALGKFGVGLYLQLLLDHNNNWKLRDDEYKGGAGILRAIRYIRMGQKYDPYYFRVGMLDRAILGNGFLMWNYNNGSNYDKRKVGLEADIDLQYLGLESVFSSFGEADLQGVSVYVRPFRFIEEANWLLKKLRFSATVIRDSKVRAVPPIEVTNMADSTTTLTVTGLGMDLNWLDLPMIKSNFYIEYGKIIDYGTGKAVGVSLTFPESFGLLALSARLEKRFLGDLFLPSVFGPLYELENRSVDPELNILLQLKNARKAEGYFGELVGHVANKILLIGNFQRLNGVANSGRLHLEASAPKVVPMFELGAYYDKSGVDTFKDVFTLDQHSVLTAEVGYQLNTFLYLTTLYRWYWVEDPDHPGNFKTIERIEPRLSFRYRF